MNNSAIHSQDIDLNRSITSQDKKTLALSSLGGALEFYDFIIYVFYAHIFAELFFPSTNALFSTFTTYATFAAGYLARPFGGIVMAHFGDKFGRKRMFTLSIALMALSVLGITILPTYETIGYAAPILLLLFRIIQGASIGGELPGAWVYVGEHSPHKKYGTYVGILTSSIISGILLGSLVAFTMSQIFTLDEIKNGWWRFPFLLGAVFGLVSIKLRSYLHETPLFKKIQASHKQDARVPISEVFKKYKTSMILGALLTWVLTAMIVVYILLTPNLMKKVYDPSSVFALQSFAIVCSMLGCWVFGKISDRFSTGIAMVISSIGFCISCYLFFDGMVNKYNLYALIPSFCIGAFCIGFVALIPNIVMKSFPGPLRFSGLSGCYNISYAIFGGLTPAIIMPLALKYDYGVMFYMLFISLLAIVLSIIYLYAVKKLAPYKVCIE